MTRQTHRPELAALIDRVIVPALLDRFLAEFAAERAGQDDRLSSPRPEQSPPAIQ